MAKAMTVTLNERLSVFSLRLCLPNFVADYQWYTLPTITTRSSVHDYTHEHVTMTLKYHDWPRKKKPGHWRDRTADLGVISTTL